MTNDEITLFWRFLENKGMKQNYMYFYSHHPLKGETRDINTFLEQTETYDAILTAFDICAAPNTIFGPKYWQDLHSKWMKKLQEARDMPQTIQCAHCGRVLPRSSFALNPKLQPHKFCRECESGEWDRKRRETEAAAKEREEKERLQKEIAEQHREENEKILSEIAEKQVNDEQKPASDESATKYSPKLGEHDATLHYKPETRKIVLNAVISAYIYTSGLTKCYLSTDRDGRQFLVFNNSEGANVTWLSMRTSRLAQVCSTPHCKQIAERFRLSIGETYYLHITKNLSKRADTINVEIKQVHTREEYAAIAARREEDAKKERPVPGEDIPEYETDARDDAPLIDFSGTEPGQQEQKPAPKKADVQVTAKPLNSPFGAAIRPALDEKAISQSLMIPLNGRKPGDLLQQLIDRNHLTEDDIATFLYNKGWKLQKPVVVTTHKKFKA